MSDNSNPNNHSSLAAEARKKRLVKLVTYAAIADVIWACLLATFQAVVFAEAGNALGASSLGTTLGTLLAWITTFIIGLIQGAIFMFVGGTFFIVLFTLLKSRADKRNDATSKID